MPALLLTLGIAHPSVTASPGLPSARTQGHRSMGQPGPPGWSGVERSRLQPSRGPLQPDALSESLSAENKSLWKSQSINSS